MIQGATRGKGGDALSTHLLRGDENEHVEVLESRGVVAVDFRLQLREIVARAAHGRTARPIHHLHADPGKVWTDAQYARHLELYEAEFGLGGQPRSGVFHRKHGRGHRHYVWSLVRRDGSVISLCHDYARREKISRVLEFEFGEKHVVGRHNRAVCRALREDGRNDVADSIVAAGLLDAARPAARLAPAERQQQERTKVSKAGVEEIVLRAWRCTNDGISFLLALEARDLTLATGQKVIVVVDRSGNVHPLARLIGQASRAHDGIRIRAADVAERIDGLEIRNLVDVRFETQVQATVEDLEDEICMAAVPAAEVCQDSERGEERLVQETAAVMAIVELLIADDDHPGWPDMSANGHDDDESQADIDAAIWLMDASTEDFPTEAFDSDEFAEVAEIAAAELMDAVDITSMQAADHNDVHTENRDARGSDEEHPADDTKSEPAPNLSGAWGRKSGGSQSDAYRDASEYAAHSKTDGQDRGPPFRRPIDTAEPSGADIAGAVKPAEPQSSPDDRHDAGNPRPPAGKVGPDISQVATQRPGKPSIAPFQNSAAALVSGLRTAYKALLEAEARNGVLARLLKRWFNLAVGAQAEVDRARNMVERIQADLTVLKLESSRLPLDGSPQRPSAQGNPGVTAAKAEDVLARPAKQREPPSAPPASSRPAP